MMARLSVCLFCSAVNDLPQEARLLAGQFGEACAQNGWRLVYGGSGRGLRGIAAGAAAAAGGEVLGFIPDHLVERERAAATVGDLHIERSLAERKQRMAEASDPFVALPGGIGTLDELVEMLTWNDLGLQDKSMILCSNDGFWDPFVELIARFRAYGVLRPRLEQRLHLARDVEELVLLIRQAQPPTSIDPSHAFRERTRHGV
jgi:uncharacterized protein (TIGR00730 family)